MILTKCPFCNHSRLYDLENNYKKCASCKKKFSLKKIEKDLRIIELFCNNVNANKASKLLDLNYRTVQNRYMIFRKLIANYNEEVHYESPQDKSSYDEFYYFTKRQKREKRKSLYSAINIIGFYSNKKIFTLLMPRLPQYNSQEENKVYENYLKWHRISSKDSYNTPLKVFWKYLEENLKKYKGVDEDNFFYYLKECEFKFNYLHNKQIEILKNLYY